MSCVFDSMTVSRMRSRLARSVEPVSVASTIASASTGGFTSVAPHENSTFDVTPSRRSTLRSPDELGGDRRAVEILRRLKRESSGRASTQRTLPKLCFA
jgi:hypothetical protein